MRTTAQLRRLFSVDKSRLDPRWSSYDVACLVDGCTWNSIGWDYRRNALRRGYQHAIEHDDSEASPDGPCPFTFSHTRAWCGHSECREA